MSSAPLSSNTTGGQGAASADPLDAALQRLAQAKPFARPRYQPDVWRTAGELLDSDAGLRALYERATAFHDAGVFHGGPWADPESLQAQLVRGCLVSDATSATVEALSELRMLATAMGRRAAGTLTAERARRFLRDVVALNLDLLFPTADERAERDAAPSAIARRSTRLFALIRSELPLDGLRVEVTEEVLDLAAQRPIVTTRIRKLVALAANLPTTTEQTATMDVLQRFSESVLGPTVLSRQSPSAASYREALLRATPDQLEAEATRFGACLRETGIAHAHHAVLLRRLASGVPTLLPLALGLDATGDTELKRHEAFVQQLIRAVIAPGSCDAIAGLASLLEHRLLSSPGIIEGLRTLIELDVLPAVGASLKASRPGTVLTANAVLTAGALSVLGQPLGIGQGSQPTCQAARGISLWAAHDPAFLLRMLAGAARDGFVGVDFEGSHVRSDAVRPEPLDAPDLHIDPVQIVLVPHLNRIYDGLMALAGGRGVDPHKWVNPAMYGRWVPKDFASCVTPDTQEVVGYSEFLALFFATHHPAYNDGATLPYPNPVGLLVTDARGRYLGPHAVSIQRVADHKGDVRVYFFNPNNDGRQRWAPDMAPTVRGNGEQPGESSLPFLQFASRLYAFHFDPYQQGDAYAVTPTQIDAVRGLAAESWAPAFTWRETTA